MTANPPRSIRHEQIPLPRSRLRARAAIKTGCRYSMHNFPLHVHAAHALPTKRCAQQGTSHAHFLDGGIAGCVVRKVAYCERYIAPMKVVAGAKECIPLPVFIASADVRLIWHKPFAVTGE